MMFKGKEVICNYSLYNSPNNQESLVADDINIELRNASNKSKNLNMVVDNNGNATKNLNYRCGINGGNIAIDFSLNDDNDVSFILCNSQGITFKSLKAHYSANETYSVNIDCNGLPRGQYVLYIIVAGEQSMEKFNIK